MFSWGHPRQLLAGCHHEAQPSVGRANCSLLPTQRATNRHQEEQDRSWEPSRSHPQRQSPSLKMWYTSRHPAPIDLGTRHTICAHLVDPPFIAQTGYLVFLFFRKDFDSTVCLSYISFEEEPFLSLGWPFPMCIGKFAPGWFRLCRRIPCMQSITVGAVVRCSQFACVWALAPPQNLVPFVNGCHRSRAEFRDQTVAAGSCLRRCEGSIAFRWPGCHQNESLPKGSSLCR